MSSNTNATPASRCAAPRGRAGLARLALAALATSAATSCLTDDQLSFSFSRSIYLNENVSPRMAEGLARDPGAVIESPEAAALLLGLPLAIDIALLPITLACDIYLGNW